MTALSLNDLRKLYGKNEQRFFELWQKFISFKSVSTNPNFETDCRNCAVWLCELLKNMGLEAELLETNSKPVVYASRKGKVAGPHILFYGHYDVQPPEPLELWSSDPFKGEVRNGRMYARGAQDNKGQVSFFLAAVQTLIEQDSLNLPLTILIEGEEETGSFGLDESLESWKDKLKADILMVCDTGSLHPRVPCITMGLRGIYHLELRVTGPRIDLHSGVFGGTVRNPAIELSRMLASLHDAEGAIAIPDFYKGIPEPTSEERALLDGVKIDLGLLGQKLGCDMVGGEKRYSFHEKRGLRPTLEINGMISGYTGPGSKTIIPSYAEAKISGRTVRGQDPERSMKLVADYLLSKAPPGVKAEIIASFVGGPAVAVEPGSTVIQQARKILSEVGDGRVEVTWEGGSIPIVARLAAVSGAAPLLVGFALDDDNMHAPNESFALEQFRLGFEYAGLALQQFAA